MLAAAVSLVGLGGMLFPALVGLLFPALEPVDARVWTWILAGLVAGLAIAVVFIKLIILVLTSRWWAPLACIAAVALFLALGGMFADLMGAGLAAAFDVIRHLTFKRPFWLLALVELPLLIVVGFFSLSGLGMWRRITVIGLASAAALLLIMALADACIRHQNENVTVLFLVDRSFSIPEEPGKDEAGKPIDRRWDRVQDFINRSVERARPRPRARSGRCHPFRSPTAPGIASGGSPALQFQV